MSITKRDIIRSRIAFKQMIKDLWVEMREKADDYYKARTKDYTEYYMNDQAKLEVPLENNNVTKRIIDRISLVYSVAPIRKYFNKETEVDKLPDKYKAAIKYKDEQYHVAEKRTNLLRFIGIKPTLREKKVSGVITPIFDYDILTEFEPIFGDDPLVPIGVNYPLTTKATVRDKTPELWVYITADDYVVYNRMTNTEVKPSLQVYEDLKNPYGTLPIVWVFDEKPELSFLDIDPAMDLVMANESINVLGTALNANVIYQSYGYIVATGLNKGDEKQLKVGPNRLTGLGREQDLQILSPPDTLESVTKATTHKIRAVALNYHLPHGFIDAEHSNPEPGVAIKERNKELQDERKGDIVRWRNTEDDVYAIEKVIMDVDLSEKIPDRMTVDYSETEEVLTPQEQRDKWEWQLKRGHISDAEILMQIDKDKYKDLEAAQKVIDDNKAASTTEAPVSLSALLAIEPEKEIQ